jgi:hypothetical protein
VWLDAPGALPVIPDRVALLGGGRVLVDGPPQDVETSPEWGSMLARAGAWTVEPTQAQGPTKATNATYEASGWPDGRRPGGSGPS